MARKFSLGNAPFIRSVDEKIISTNRMMKDVVIALIPIIIFAWVKNGLIPYLKVDGFSFLNMLWPLIFVLVGGLSSIVLEALYFALFTDVKTFKEVMKKVNTSFALIPGLLLALCLPIYTPLWVLMFGCLFANIIFKMLFGGFGYNIFNPALIAYVIVIVAFSSVIPSSPTTGVNLNPYEDLYLETSTTPLADYTKKVDGKLINIGADYDQIVKPYGNLGDFLIGTIPGSMGETSALLCILAFIYLLVRRTINWRVPVIYVGTVFVITMIIGLINKQGLWYPTFNVLSGGLLFGAVFMATEPVTTPRSPNGKVIFAFGLGVLTVLFRLVGAMSEGVATSILFMCLFTPVIDSFASKLRINRNSREVVLKYSVIAILFIAIAGYTIYKCSPAANRVVAADVEFVSIEQDFDNLNNFEVKFNQGGTQVTVTYSYDFNQTLTFVTSSVELTETEKVNYLKLVQLPSLFIKQVEGNKVVAVSSGYNKRSITGTFTVNANKIDALTITHQESYDSEYNSNYNGGNPFSSTIINDQYIDQQNNLNNIISLDTKTLVTGATLSSNGLKEMFLYVLDYLKEVK